VIGITDIASYLPQQRIDNLQRASELGSTPEQVEQRIGFCKVARMGEGENTLALANKALTKLMAQNQMDPSQIDVLVVVTQNPDRNIPHLSAELHGLMKMSSQCACFDISLGCSGYVYGLSVITSFMQVNGFKVGVLVTADPYSKIVDQHDKSTSLIFGDGATATLFTDKPVFSLGNFCFGTQGSEAHNLACNDGVLFMNGRAVFNFTAINIPDSIHKVVEKNGLIMDQIDLFVLHQGSRYIVQTIADRLLVNREKVPFMAAEYGNTVSSSIPMMLTELIKNQVNRTMVLCAFGLGFSWASTVIKREECK
jgi:3-oxoacyl-[acyl-carrier-protein] synthase-3